MSSPSDVGVYVRISSDPLLLRDGVERQRDDCLDECERQGWNVGDVYEDNDLSAYKGDVRPEFERMLRDLRSGEIGGVVFWHLDRLTRRPRELEDFIDVCEEHDVHPVHSVTGGALDLSTSSGRSMARVSIAFAALESEHKGERIRRSLQQKAERGEPHGGVHPYGYEKGGMLIVPKEAAVIEKMADRVLAGQSVMSVTKWLNDSDIPSRQGVGWSAPTVRNILTNPRYVGRRIHNGVDVGEAAWPPILDEDTFHVLGSKFAQQASDYGGLPRTRRYLLPGLLRCGLCKQPLSSFSRKNRDGSPAPAYRCWKHGNNQKSCGGVTIGAPPLDEYVKLAAFAVLADSKRMAQISSVANMGKGESGPDPADLARVYDRLDVLHDDYYDPENDLTEVQFRKQRDRLTQKIESLESDVARAADASVLESVPLDPKKLESAWDENDLAWRQAVLRCVLDHVVVNPAVRSGPQQNPMERTRLIWVDAAKG